MEGGTVNKPLWGIIYDPIECNCEACTAWYEWFDSDSNEDPPERTCANRAGAVAFIDFRELENADDPRKG